MTRATPTIERRGAFGQRYQLLEPLGQGGMGVVYRARDRLGGMVALKRIRLGEFAVSSTAATLAAGSARWPGAGEETAEASVAASPAEVAVDRAYSHTIHEVDRLALTREFETLASLRHPNIIDVLDYGFDDDGLPYYTMELLERSQPFLEAGRALSLEGRLNLLEQLLRALRYLHRRGVVHRDLKPGNVLVQARHVKVLDFGLATLLGGEIRLGFIGTPAYMAPELRAGWPPSTASDLYGVGVMARELLGDDARPQPVVSRLLAQRPEDRFHDAGEVIGALSAATAAPLAVETAATRESSLQAAPLVGRDAELALLSSLLADVQKGRGAARLLVGESGVGKSRLLAELAVRALVGGAPVLKGQAVSEGGTPYQLWREPLRWLAIFCDPDEYEAGVLRPLVPDIGALLEREVAPANELDPEAGRARVHSVVEAMLRRLGRPLVLVLEDLQWANSSSLRLLKRMAELTAELPILIVASCRDELPLGVEAELPPLERLELQRLSAQAIAALCHSMIGPHGARPNLLERLQRETEGNPFFLVEAVRALAEQVADLDAVGAAPLPEGPLSLSLQRIVERRLRQAPAGTRPLLELAAVAGRQVDMSLLSALEPEAALDEWLSLCTSARVLDVADGRARFTHDKLREGLLAELPDRERRPLHARVAMALEQLYRAGKTTAAPLAHHYGQAGIDERAAHFAALAGKEALQSSAYREAVRFFEQAIALVPDDGRSDPDSAGFLRAHLMGLCAEALGQSGDQVRAGRYCQAALEQLGEVVPAGRAAGMLALLRELATLLVDNFTPLPKAEPSPVRRRVHGEATRVHNRLAPSLFYQERTLASLWSAFRAINLGERSDAPADLAISYGAICVLPVPALLSRGPRVAGMRAVALAERSGRTGIQAMALHRKSIHHLMQGEWTLSRDGLERACAIYQQLGDRRNWEECSSVLGVCLGYQGRFAEGFARQAQVYASARARSDQQSTLWGGQLGAFCRLRLGENEAAHARLEELLGSSASMQTPERINQLAPMALAALRLDDRPSARGHAAQALQAVRRGMPLFYWIHHSLGMLAETLLSLWETEEEALLRAELERQATEACRALRSFGRAVPIGRPASLLWNGLSAQLSNQPRRARRFWQAAIDEARRLEMPYEEARARLERGRHQSGSSRRLDFERAAELFSAIGARPELQRIRSLG
jgi:tetratricopeptide (TPR) repeat protein